MSFIIADFCLILWGTDQVDDRVGKLEKRSDATLYPSELVTIELLYMLKDGFFRTFYRWLKRDFEHLFIELPDRTRIPRACGHTRTGAIACWQIRPSSPSSTSMGLN